ncbi:AAA family ATPase [Facklamia sp. P13069]|uniref:AAA family ATPase n=1 Tax=Facklamia sp. P13069 TaxID=3421954 RepID=UPI003D186775
MLFNKVSLKIDYLSEEQIVIPFYTLPNPAEKDGQYFDVKNYSLAILYGKNGSGKSSIANGCYHYSLNEQIESEEITEDSNPQSIKFEMTNNQVSSCEVTNAKVYSFSEGFILDKIDFRKQKDLNAIVMLGDQKKYRNILDSLESDLKSKEEDKKKCENVLTEMQDDYQKDYKKLEKILRAKNGWAEKEKLIRKLSINGRVTDELLDKLSIQAQEIPDDEVPKKVEKNKSEFDNCLEKLTQIRKTPKLPTPEPLDPLNENIDDEIENIFATVLQEPHWTERETKIFKEIEEKGANHFSELIKLVNTDTCPTCFQTIETNYRNELIESLKKMQAEILNDESDAFIKRIDSINIKSQPSLSNEIVNFQQESIKKLADEYKENLDIYSREKDNLKKLLEKKKDFLYTPLEDSYEKILDIYEKLNQSYSSLVEEIKKHNDLSLEEDKIITKACELNFKITAMENKANLEVKEKVSNLIKEKENEITKLDEELSEIREKINATNSQLKQTHVALEQINEDLSYIFFDRNRLQLKSNGDGGYDIFSKGKKVTLSSLSTGEKNIISLCYFFSCVGENKSIEDKYIDEALYIIDDPITSLDFGNAVGLYTYINSQIRSIGKGNKSSKVLIMTHDLGIYYNLTRIFEDVNSDMGKYLNYELKGGKVIRHSEISKLTSGYKNNVNHLYEYACKVEGTKELDSTIGNITRKVLEAFSSFTYDTGIAEVSINQNILDKIPVEKDRVYFQALMYRLLAHGESHDDLYGKNITGIANNILDRDNKLQLTQLVLFFIYSLNPLHLSSHIKNLNVNLVESWSPTNILHESDKDYSR